MTQPQLKPSSFAEEIAALVSLREAEPSQRAEFLEIWRQFAKGLRSAQVEAEVRQSEQRKTFSLVLWPEYRPSWHHFMLTFSIDEDGVRVFGQQDVLLESSDDLKRWLREFAQSPHFRGSLRALGETASDPVSAALVMSDGREIVVEVSAEQQRAIASISSPETTMTVSLARGETRPIGEFPLYFRSAGFEFNIKSATARGRQIELLLEPNV